VNGIGRRALILISAIPRKTHKHRLIFALVILSVVWVQVSAQTKWSRVSSFKFNWDNHPDVRVTLEIPTSWNDPGDFTRILISVPGKQLFVLTNKEGWVKYAAQEAVVSPEVAKKNVVDSEYLLALRATGHDRLLLFLIGYAYASSPGTLDVIEISPSGQPRVILHRDELGLAGFHDLDGDDVAEIVGRPCLSQVFGNGLITYDPLHVFKLAVEPGGRAMLSLPLTKSYNLAHYYGWAGPVCSEKYAVVLHPPKGGRPVVTTLEKAEQMTASGK